MRLTRHPANPILLPNSDSEWESLNVFNPAVVQHSGLFHMLYRAQGPDRISRIGHAVSEDGVAWRRQPRPILEPEGELEAMGVEDPRLTELDGMFYLAYTGFGGEREGKLLTTPLFAKSTNLMDWERIGPLVQGEENKDHCLLPAKVNGRFAAFHRRPPSIWVAYSENLVDWPEDSMREILPPSRDGWDSERVGANGPPILTEHGWLTFYHGYDQTRTYRLGVCLLDLGDPGRVLSRPAQPIFEPEETWELEGEVPRVVFSCTNLLVGDQVYVYYGAADRVIALATAHIGELIDYAGNG
jgi:predicted GH43/DUF377 family glycosyl hydrolase